ncbi:hypothetical protein D1007_45510 [Hordeum vulgare]|nr:hypothetical protein D1007_45510 [Hordeum vulgare]
MGESGESGEGTNGDKGGTNGDKSSPCGGSVVASRSGAGSAQTVISSGGDGQQIPSGMDPAIAFFLSIRMQTTVLVSGVEIRYWNSSKLCWVPVQCDAELGVMFASNATTMSCNLEITVIQRTRGQRCVNPSSSRPSASRTRASSRTPSAPRTPSVNATASVNESQEHQKKTLDPVVEEALPDAPAVEDEVLYPGYVQHNNDEEDATDKEYIPAEFSDADEDEKQEDVEMGVFEDAAEDRPVEMYDRENPCIAEGVVFPSAVDCRNAVASFSIKSETEFLTLKSDPTRFTVKCAYERCKWRLHASLMRNSTLFQIKVNTYQHTCPSVNRSQRLRAAKRRWIADASMSWIRANPGIDEHWGADNADDHPTTNEPAQAEIQEEEEEVDETTPDVQQQMPPPKEPSHDASTEASCAVSPRKNYKRVAGRGPSPRCVKQNIGVEQELESKGSSPKRAATTVEAPNPAKNTRSKAMQAPNPAKNTRSKKLMF